MNLYDVRAIFLDAPALSKKGRKEPVIKSILLKTPSDLKNGKTPVKYPESLFNADILSLGCKADAAMPDG